MLRLQLEKIKRDKKTLLIKSKNSIHFVDEDLDNETIRSMIKISSSYTSARYLTFERQRLSEIEESKFNSKFSNYLESLIEHMEDPDISFCLEFLVRIYNADTFNTRELFFLLLPFRTYAEQIRRLGKHLNSDRFAMEEYSVKEVARLLLRSSSTFYEFVRYTKYYAQDTALGEFINGVISYLPHFLNTANFTFHSEMYQIMENLISRKHSAKALELYHCLFSLLQNEEFKNLLLQHFPPDALANRNSSEPAEDILSSAYHNADGRKFLSNDSLILQYISFLKESELSPREFSSDEYALLLQWAEHSMDIELPSIRPYLLLYKELANKRWLTNLFLSSENIMIDEILELYKLMPTEESVVVVQHLNKSEKLKNLVISTLSHFLTNNNHQILLKNMQKQLFIDNYSSILKICLNFSECDIKIFDKLVDIDSPTNLQLLNLIRIAEYRGIDLTSRILQQAQINPLYISYLLRCNKEFTIEQCCRIIEASKTSDQPCLIAEAASFLLLRQNQAKLKEITVDLCNWAYKNNMLSSVTKLVKNNISDMPTPIIWHVFLNDNYGLLDELDAREFPVMERLYETEKYHIIYSIAQERGVSKALISHPNTPVFIEKYYRELEGRHDLVKFILLNLEDSEYLCLLPLFESELIHYRKDKLWSAIKILVEESITDSYKAQACLTAVVGSIEDFVGDHLLFKRIFEAGAVLSSADVKGMRLHCQPAADIVDLAISHGALDILPVLPLIAPILISFQKHTVYSLFRDFSGLMSVYAPNILKEYPSAADLLTSCDPRHSLMAIINSDSDCTEVLNSIFSRKTCKSIAISERVASWMENVQVPSDVLYNFIFFYVRSHGNSTCASISSLLSSVLQRNPEFFEYFTTAEGKTPYTSILEMNTCVFKYVFVTMLEHIRKGRIVAPEFISACIKYRVCPDALLEFSHLEICKLLIKRQSGFNIIISLCKDCPSIIPGLIDVIVGNIQKSEDVTLGLILLACLFRNITEVHASCREEVFALAISLSEGTDKLISEAAQELCEIIQS